MQSLLMLPWGLPKLNDAQPSTAEHWNPHASGVSAVKVALATNRKVTLPFISISGPTNPEPMHFNGTEVTVVVAVDVTEEVCVEVAVATQLSQSEGHCFGMDSSKPQWLGNSCKQPCGS
jgi:hypothetical protein